MTQQPVPVDHRPGRTATLASNQQTPRHQWTGVCLRFALHRDTPGGVSIDNLHMVIDTDGVLFVRRGDTLGRCLPWSRIVAVTFTDTDTDANTDPVAGAYDVPKPAGTTVTVALHTESGSYLVDLYDPAHHLQPLLTAVAPPGIVGDIRAGTPPSGIVASAQPHGALRQPDRLTRQQPSHLDTRRPTQLDRLRPVLIPVLVAVVAAMVALVLAQSVGAVHLAWLGGTGGSTPASAPYRVLLPPRTRL